MIHYILIFNISFINCQLPIVSKCDSIKTVLIALKRESVLNHIYQGERLPNLLNDSMIKNSNYRWVYQTHRPGILTGITIIIEDCIEVSVSLKRRRATSSFQNTRNWSLSKVKNNRIEEIMIYKSH